MARGVTPDDDRRTLEAGTMECAACGTRFEMYAAERHHRVPEGQGHVCPHCSYENGARPRMRLIRL